MSESVADLVLTPEQVTVQARRELDRWAGQHEPGLDTSGWDVTEVEEVRVFTHPTLPRRYLVSGRCVAVVGPSPEHVLEGIGWLR